jgi:uncharacterized membrane protein
MTIGIIILLYLHEGNAGFAAQWEPARLALATLVQRYNEILDGLPGGLSTGTSKIALAG